jgi:hypothetical protein
MDRLVKVEHRHKFTTEELRGLAEEQDEAIARVYEVENDKKLASSNYGAALKSAQAKVADLHHKRRLGFEMREVDAIVRLNVPRNGLAEVVLKDSGEIIETREMSAAEKQDLFDFGGSAQ